MEVKKKHLFRQASMGTKFLTNVQPLEEKYMVWCQGLLFFKEQFTHEDLQHLVGKRLLDIPRFRSTYDFKKQGFCELEKEEVDLSYHLQVVEEDLSTEEVLESYMGDMFEHVDVDFAKPLWYCIYFPKLKDGRSLLFLSISHIIGDGVSLIELIFDLMDKDLDLDAMKKQSLALSNGSKKSGQVGTKEAAKQLSEVAEAKSKSLTTTKIDKDLVVRKKKKKKKGGHHFGPLNLLLIFLKGIWDAIIAAVAFFDSKTPLFRDKKQPPSARKSIALSTPIPLDKVKQLKNKFHGATVNDVLVSVMNLAILAYLKEEGMTQKQLDKKQMRASFPINTRKIGAPVLKNGSPSNNFSVGYFSFITSYSSRIDLVHQVKKMIDKVKLSPLPIVQYWLGKLSTLTLPRSVLAKLFLDYTNQASAMLSNVPGPQKAVRLQGYELDDLHFGLYTTAGLYLGLMSYNNKVGCTICLDSGLGEAEQLAHFWNREFEMLYEEVMKKEGILKPSKRWYTFLEYL